MSYQNAGITTIFLHPKQADLLLQAGILTPEQITITQPIPNPESNRIAESKTPKEHTTKPLTLEILNSYLQLCRK